MALLIRKMQLDGIPISIYETEDNKDKPVIFSFHGFTGYKDGDYFKREDTLARIGFIVVSIDSILHGERRIEMFESLTDREKQKDINTIIIQSAHDAVSLYEKYIRHMSRVKKDELYAFGVSMGGAISILMASIYPLKKAVSIVGSPSMVEFYKYKQSQYNWADDELYDLNLKYLESFDPVLNKEKIKCPLFLTGGLKDDVIPVKFIKMLEKDNVVIKLYDTPHMPNQAQFDDAYQFLLEEVC